MFSDRNERWHSWKPFNVQSLCHGPIGTGILDGACRARRVSEFEHSHAIQGKVNVRLATQKNMREMRLGTRFELHVGQSHHY